MSSNSSITDRDREQAKEYADSIVKQKSHLSMMDHSRLAAAFEAGMAKQRELDGNRQDNLNEMGKAYVRVCRKLGINGNIAGYVRKLGSIADKLYNSAVDQDVLSMHGAMMEYKAEFLTTGKPFWKEKDAKGE